MGRRLYVGNLSYNTSDALLRESFARVGGVESVEVIRDRWTGLSRGFGFVEMLTFEDAEAAIDELDGSELMGRLLRVAVAKPRNTVRTSGPGLGV